VHVSPAAPTASGSDENLSGFGEVTEKLSGLAIENNRAYRHANNQGLGTFAMAIAALAVLSPASSDDGPMLQIEQRAQVDVRQENDIASMSPVAAGGAALGSKFFAPKGNSSVAAVAGFDWKNNFVHESHGATLAQAIALANSPL
jgi:hypothetical protein